MKRPFVTGCICTKKKGARDFFQAVKTTNIGLLDITTISKNIASNGDYLVFVPALVIYLIMTAFFTFVFGKVEKRLSLYL